MQSDVDRGLRTIYEFLDRLSLNSSYSRDEVLDLKGLILGLKPGPGAQQVPSVGRTVHYFDYNEKGDTEPYAAIVTGVDEPGDPRSILTLTVFYPEHIQQTRGIPKCESPKEAWHWDWPEYVAPK